MATATVHLTEGKFLYFALCLLAIAVMVIPPIIGGSSHMNMPIELELALLWWLVADMTIGRLGTLYDTSWWFDKALHFGNSTLLAMLAFLIVYALHLTGGTRASVWVSGLLVVLITLGLGAFWEIVEYLADKAFARGAQGSPILAPLDDTMWDLMLDGLGGCLGAFAGTLYTRCSKRSRGRVRAFEKMLSERAQE